MIERLGRRILGERMRLRPSTISGRNAPRGPVILLRGASDVGAAGAFG